jgi:predicted nucleic acid-binding protein
VTLVLDAGPLVALADQGDPFQADVERILRSERGALVLPAPVSAEVDHLLGRIGRRARLAFLDDLAADRFLVECLDQDDHELVAQLERRYEDLDLGLSDLSLVVLARRFRTRRLLTFDERHFRAIRPVQGGTFTLLPADQSISAR